MSDEEKLIFQLGRISVAEELMKLAERHGIIHLCKSNVRETLQEEQDKHDEILKKIKDKIK